MIVFRKRSSYAYDINNHNNLFFGQGISIKKRPKSPNKETENRSSLALKEAIDQKKEKALKEAYVDVFLFFWSKYVDVFHIRK